MNHNPTLTIVAIVAASALMAAFAIPQQVLAYRHHNHNNNHNANGIKVDQQINQLNSCTGVPSQAPGMRPSAPSHSENTR